ncbi:MAG: hypothetical protein J5640_02245 [Bacteroidales bacterium]|nr:hypothetical protein [Bacteroidales bacterium]
MKTIKTIRIIMLGAAICACQKSQTVTEAPEGPKMIEVRAVFADGEVSSKASLAEGSTQFAWNASDEVVAWDGSAATQNCAITDIDANGVATFSIPAGSEWVIYPSAALTVSGNTATWTRPIGQPVSDADQIVGNGANPMFGKVNGDEVEFTNLCGYIQFNFTGTKTLNRMFFKSNNITSPALTGQASIDVSAATPVLSYPVLSTLASGQYQYGYTNVSGLNLTLDPTTPTPVMVVLPPATYEAGEIVLLFSDGTSLSIISNNDLTVTRNTVLRVKTIDVDSKFPASPVALDADGRSNCYMVIASDEPQAYSFEAASIMDGTPFSLAKSANMVWSEDKKLINNITYDANTHRVTFQYNGGGREGNALVAIDQSLENDGGTLLWNYHIWVTDQPEDIKMSGSAMPQAIMDRNVGSTWAPKTEAEVTGMTKAQWLETIGTYYQYGNHIPYPRITDARNSSAAWDMYKVSVMYGFSRYCHRFTASTGVKNTLAEQERYPNYAYHKSTGTKYGSATETIWTNVVLKGGPKGETGQNIWITNNSATAKTNDYDPCPQGYCLITATHTYNATKDYPVSDHLLNSYFAGKYNIDTENHLMYYPAAGYLGNGKYALVGGVSDNKGRVVYWSYYLDSGTDMDHKFRRNFMNQAQTTFSYDNQPFSSQAHNMRCRKL